MIGPIPIIVHNPARIEAERVAQTMRSMPAARYVFVVLLLIGVFVLVRSMNRHLKRVPQSFDAPDDADSREPPRESGG